MPWLQPRGKAARGPPALPRPFRFPGANPVPLTALHAGASHRAPAARFGPVPDLWGPAPLGPPDLRQASPIPGGPGGAQRRSRLFPARPSGSDASLSGRPSRVLPSAHSLPPTLGGGPQPHARPRLQPRGRAAGLLRSLQPGSRRRSLQGSNGGPVASRTGPQYAALTRVLNFPEMARFFYGLMSAPPERGD
ncbi:hypothetical protein NDU88_000609 [Pleurodeles waltl]|uniref:Uncharacterized protein n=1 Tax=Pleurodeles waltl TaxID=8319 RepID=A0AAV7N8D8_PLEWA|nr:hypothetical protein NDU88_000609 [Pleurodeles waltl]